MLLGLVLVTVVMVWLATGPSLSPKSAGPDPRPVPSSAARRPAETGGARSNRPPQEGPARSNNFSTNGLTLQSVEENQSGLLDSTIYEKTEKIKTQKFHIIREGETLSIISYKYYGSANKWQMIFKANRNVIKDVNKLRPGTKIIIPE